MFKDYYTLTHLLPFEYFWFSHNLPSLPFIITFKGIQCAQYPKPFGLGSVPLKYPLLDLPLQPLLQ